MDLHILGTFWGSTEFDSFGEAVARDAGSIFFENSWVYEKNVALELD